MITGCVLYLLQLLEAAASAKPRCRGEDGFQLQLLQAELCALGYLVDLKVVAPDEALATRQGPVHILENLHHQYLLCTGTRDAPRMVCFSCLWLDCQLLAVSELLLA